MTISMPVVVAEAFPDHPGESVVSDSDGSEHQRVRHNTTAVLYYHQQDAGTSGTLPRP